MVPTYTKIYIGILISVLCVEVIWIKTSSSLFIYNKKDIYYEFLFLACLLLPYVFYKSFRPDLRMVALLETTFFAFAYSPLMLLLTCLVATQNQPLIDSTLVSIDNYLGVYVQAIDFWFRGHDIWQRIFEFMYNTFLYQFPFVLFYFTYSNKPIYLQRFLMMIMIATPLTITISGFFPALGPFEWYHYMPHIRVSNALHHMIELRQNIVDINKEPGIVTFPSFHTVMALLYTYIFKNEKLIIFIPVLIINLLMIFSCIPIGEHYFIDLPAAIPVFLVTIGIERILYKKVIEINNKRCNDYLLKLSS